MGAIEQSPLELEVLYDDSWLDEMACGAFLLIAVVLMTRPFTEVGVMLRHDVTLLLLLSLLFLLVVVFVVAVVFVGDVAIVFFVVICRWRGCCSCWCCYGSWCCWCCCCFCCCWRRRCFSVAAEDVIVAVSAVLALDRSFP